MQLLQEREHVLLKEERPNLIELEIEFSEGSQIGKALHSHHIVAQVQESEILEVAEVFFYHFNDVLSREL